MEGPKIDGDDEEGEFLVSTEGLGVVIEGREDVTEGETEGVNDLIRLAMWCLSGGGAAGASVLRLWLCSDSREGVIVTMSFFKAVL